MNEGFRPEQEALREMTRKVMEAMRQAGRFAWPNVVTLLSEALEIAKGEAARGK
jgi:hypothetical protein